jgi:hypothetical protein
MSAWSLDDIPFANIDRAAVAARDDLMYLVTGASFVEIASDLYTKNLVQHYAADGEVTAWLESAWEHEEVQHGHALRAYSRAVWPEFPWDEAFAAFLKEYSTLCDLEHFEPTPGLEMVARCVIEMGTASFYKALAIAAHEPVLTILADRIQADEVGHYKQFLRFFLRYNEGEKHGRLRIIKAIWHRLLEVRGDDANCAIWHVFHARFPDIARDSKQFKQTFSSSVRSVRTHFPSAMAVKMLTRPLNLPGVVARLIQPPLAQVAQRLILR